MYIATCNLFICLSLIAAYLVSDRPRYYLKTTCLLCAKIFLEIMTHHQKIRFFLSRIILEHLEGYGFLLNYPCFAKRTLWKVHGGA